MLNIRHDLSCQDNASVQIVLLMDMGVRTNKNKRLAITHTEPKVVALESEVLPLQVIMGTRI